MLCARASLPLPRRLYSLWLSPVPQPLFPLRLHPADAPVHFLADFLVFFAIFALWELRIIFATTHPLFDVE